ncbi:hypothetical protein [Nonomuraea rubra]|uniref:hypothetical protein n=1 Tax=Nonomuraea rubra TaxID=46180 RepID=UPI0033FE5E58
MFKWNDVKVGDFVSWGDELEDPATVKVVGVDRYEDSGEVRRISYESWDHGRDAVEVSIYLGMKYLTRGWRCAQPADIANWEARRATFGPAYTNSWD